MLTSATLNVGGSASVPIAANNNRNLIFLHHQASKSLSVSPSPLLNLPKFTTPTSWSLTTSVKTAVAAVDSSDPAQKVQEQANTKYYFVIANANFMLDEEEHFRELMFEKQRLYEERNLERDFWLVIEPKFLDKFPNIAKRLKRPAVALVSTNRPWITYMKLRLDRVLQESYEADSVEEALASNPVNIEFEKPEKWVAPYEKYETGWWESFLPPGSEKSKA